MVQVMTRLLIASVILTICFEQNNTKEEEEKVSKNVKYLPEVESYFCVHAYISPLL